MEPNPLSTEPAGYVGAPAMAWTGQEVAFRRRFSSILNRQGQWFTYGLVALIAVLTVVIFLLPSRAPAGAPVRVNSAYDSRMHFDGIMILALSLTLLVGYLLSRGYERLYLSHTGIRYVTWLGGPAAFLASFYPSWELRWDDLTDIRLVKRQAGRGMYWYYVFTPKLGKERRTNIAWNVVGGPPDNLGISLWQLMNSDVAAYKAGIARTQLFRLLDLAMRARKGQFKHPLIQDQ